MEVRFTPTGRTQFLATIESIRKNSRSAAEQFRRRSGKALKRLPRFPASGAPVTEFPDLPYREIYVKPYRFFYRAGDNTIWIVAVWHGAQIPRDPNHLGGPHEN